MGCAPILIYSVLLNAWHQNQSPPSPDWPLDMLKLTASVNFTRGALFGEAMADIKGIFARTPQELIQTEIINRLRLYQEVLLHEFEPSNMITQERRAHLLQEKNDELRLMIGEMQANLSAQQGTPFHLLLPISDLYQLMI